MFADRLVQNSEFVAPGESPRSPPPPRQPSSGRPQGCDSGAAEGSDALFPAGEAAGGGCAGVGASGLVRRVGCEGEELQRWGGGEKGPSWGEVSEFARGRRWRGTGVMQITCK